MERVRKLWPLWLGLPWLLGCALFGASPTPWQPQIAATDTPPIRPPTHTPPPTPTLVATPPPTATGIPPTPAAEEGQQIFLDTPASGAQVGNPLQLSGSTTRMPFEGTLVVRVYDAHDQLAVETPIIAEGELGGPARFSATIVYGGVPGAGRVEVLEFSARDGTLIASASAAVTLLGFPGGGYVVQPPPQTKVTLPILLQARVGQPGQQVNVTLTWHSGTQFSHVLTTLTGEDGRGLLVTALDWVQGDPAYPPTQPAAIAIHTLEGTPLAWQPLHVLHPGDPETMEIALYWISRGNLVMEQRRIPRTRAMGSAALEALLWGPPPHNLQGYTTAIPTPGEVLAYPARTPAWGERVYLNKLTIEEGVAHADFSPEITAHSGGSQNVALIRAQIEQTLRQFSTVREVAITVDGQRDALEP